MDLSQLPETWDACNDGEGLGQELAAETSKGHPLYGRNLIGIASSDVEMDDVLFRDTDEENLFYVVHLTWKKNDTPPWPAIVFSGTWDEFIVSESSA